MGTMRPLQGEQGQALDGMEGNWNVSIFIGMFNQLVFKT